VLGYGELLANAPLSEQHRAWLAALRSHGDIMLRLVNDLIDLGALQSGSFRLEAAPADLRNLIEKCTAALRPAADAKRLAFRVEIDPAMPPWVRADGVRLRQVLLNLLNNAVKFTPSGSVMLRVRCVSDAMLEFVVSDTGPGIPAELRSRLFQPFMRLDPAAGGGSGLGLALVQGLCTAMKGSVELAEGTGAGATFVVRLPFARCEPPTSAFATEALPVTSRFAGLRVLVAEDNTLVRELLMAFLAENGAEVTVAPDGPTALELARERVPDVLLLDVALPGLDGISVAEHLRRDGPRPLRIIGLSAHASRSDETRARGAGMDEFLAKPVRLAALADAITGQSAAESPRSFSERITDDQLRARLLTQFATETPRVLAELRASLQDDWPRARSRAHYLKNSADVLGDAAMRAACDRLASLEQSPGLAAAHHLVDAIEAAIPSKLLVLANIAATDQN
jgi:CheY-like chemotaxis protein/anti-sigma regulatory factor (Ser/Thr protein kinase)